MSSSNIRVCNIALDIANKSNIHIGHGAVITKGKKPIAIGFNHNRSVINGKLCCCFHAEIHAIHRWRLTCFRDKRKNISRKGKKYNLYVVRKSNSDDKLFSLSKPCFDCIKIIKLCNFGKIIYTTGNSDIISNIKLSKLENNNMSWASRSMLNTTHYSQRLNYI